MLNDLVKIWEEERKFFNSLTLEPLVFTKEEMDIIKEERNKPKYCNFLIIEDPRAPLYPEKKELSFIDPKGLLKRK